MYFSSCKALSVKNKFQGVIISAKRVKGYLEENQRREMCPRCWSKLTMIFIILLLWLRAFQTFKAMIHINKYILF